MSGQQKVFPVKAGSAIMIRWRGQGRDKFTAMFWFISDFIISSRHSWSLFYILFCSIDILTLFQYAMLSIWANTVNPSISHSCRICTARFFQWKTLWSQPGWREDWTLGTEIFSEEGDAITLNSGTSYAPSFDDFKSNSLDENQQLFLNDDDNGAQTELLLAGVDDLNAKGGE